MKMTTMNVGVVDNNRRPITGWRRALRTFSAMTGLFAAVGAATSVGAAQDTGYRSAATAPASWQAFARQLQSRFEQRLASDDKESRAFQDHMSKGDAASNVQSPTIVARAWILPDGKVERLEFDGLNNEEIAVDLRALLTRENVGVPPPDMLQPLRLRLSLRPKDQPTGGR